MEAWKEVRDCLEARGFQQVGGSSGDVYEGIITVGREKISLQIEIVDFDFVTLPLVKLKNVDNLALKIRGHLMADDCLCYGNKDTYLLDRFQPGASILTVLDSSIETLRVLLYGNATPEVLNELQAYWGGQPRLILDDPFSLTTATLGSLTNHDGRSLSVLGSREERILEWANKTSRSAEIEAPIHVIQCDGDLLLPQKVLKTLEQALEWARQQAHDCQDVDAASNEAADGRPALLLVGRNAILGFRAKPDPLSKAAKSRGFRPKSVAAMPLTRQDKIGIDRFWGLRADRDELIARNYNGSAPLSDCKIAVIGCGTIGGHLAKTLLQSGAGHNEPFLLIDDDTFTPSNVGRHHLGVKYVGRKKSEALKASLESDFPDARIDANTDDARRSFSRLSGFHLVIDVTGSEQFSNALNAQAVMRAKKGEFFPPVLYGMIFGNGVAVQTFLTTSKPGEACFRCLRPEYGKPWRYSPMKATASTSLVVRPCGESTFTPYGVEASLHAALLALEHVLDFATTGKSEGLRTRVVNKAEGIAQPNRSVTTSDKCPSCSS